MATALEFFNAVKNPFFRVRDFKRDVDTLQNENQIGVLSDGAKILHERNPRSFKIAVAIPALTAILGITGATLGVLEIKSGRWTRGSLSILTALTTLGFARRKVIDVTSACAAEGYYSRINHLMDKHLSDVLKADKMDELKGRAHVLVGQGRLDGVSDLLHDGVTSMIKNVAERQVDDKLGNFLPNT